jgi:hypothetical protein
MWLVVLAHARALPKGTPIVTTVVTFGEDLSGWLPDCRRAKNGLARVQAYACLSKGLDFYRRITCLPFNENAATLFDELRVRPASSLKIGRSNPPSGRSKQQTEEERNV